MGAEQVTTAEDSDREDGLVEATAEDVEAAIRRVEAGSADESESIVIGS